MARPARKLGPELRITPTRERASLMPSMYVFIALLLDLHASRYDSRAGLSTQHATSTPCKRFALVKDGGRSSALEQIDGQRRARNARDLLALELRKNGEHRSFVPRVAHDLQANGK